MEVNGPNTMNYYVGSFTTNGKTHTVFLHEAEWVLNNKQLIPEGMLVCHKDGNTHNNNIYNLYLVPENGTYGDLHYDRIFHQNDHNVDLIREHFPDIATVLGF